jgi:hypothetical protein
VNTRRAKPTSSWPKPDKITVCHPRTGVQKLLYNAEAFLTIVKFATEPAEVFFLGHRSLDPFSLSTYGAASKSSPVVVALSDVFFLHLRPLPLDK